ncbi:MAG: zinc ribbon domain-containing protein [Clostridia bacterium]|nr:zinc ribbon domain-containing protein [Clostridia bacterium]
MGQMIEGRWDCSSCGRKLIPGRYKHCPGCGKGRGEDVKFYIADPNDVVDADTVEQGPDWMCEYCESYNPDSARFCANCGAERSGKTYFDVQKEQEAKQQSPQPATRTAPAKKGGFIKWALIALALLAVLFFLGRPHDSDASVTAKSWQRQIAVEVYRWVEDSGWSLPEGAVLQSSGREIRTYREVFDHYETRTRQVPEQYITGYTTQYRDMGNGYFETYEVPQYGTRYRTEEYQERVYRQEPVYDTWYQYTVQRWQYDRTLTASGTDDAPYWPQLTLAADTEREGGRDEEYRIVFADKDGTYPLRMTQGEWEKYSVGDAVVLTVSPSGNVQEIKKK